MRKLYGLLLFFVTLATSASDQVVFASKLALEKPQGFEKATEFEGFIQPATNSFILIRSFPLPLDQQERRKALAETKDSSLLEKLKSQGITAISSQRTAIGNDPQALFITGEQTINNQNWGRIIAVLHFDNQVFSIYASHPQDNQNLYTTMAQSIKSAVPISNAEVHNALERPFKFKQVDGLKVANTPYLTAELVQLSQDGEPSGPQYGAPFLQIVASPEIVNTSDKTEYAIKMFDQMEYMQDVKILTTNQVSQAGLPSVEIIARGSDDETGVPLTVYQLIKFRQDNGYFLITGMIAQKQAEIYLNKFKQVALSVREADDKTSEDEATQDETTSAHTPQIPDLITALDSNLSNMNVLELTALMQSKPDSSRYLPGGIARHTWDLNDASTQLKMQVWFDKNKQLESYHIGSVNQTVEGCYLFSSPENTAALLIKPEGEASFMKMTTKESSSTKSSVRGSFSSTKDSLNLHGLEYPVSLQNETFTWVNNETLAIEGIKLSKVEPDLCDELNQKVLDRSAFSMFRDH